MKREPPAFAKPTIFHWGVLVSSLLFVAAGFSMLPDKPDRGIVTIAFFGSVLAAAAHTVLRKQSDSRIDLRWAELVGGVPIRPSRSGVLLLAIWLSLLGLTLGIFGRSAPPVFQAMAWLIVVVGVLLLLGCVLGWVPVGYLQFDPAGITIAGRGSRFLVPWDRISALRPGDVHDNAALFIFLNGLDGVTTTPPSQHARTLKLMASNQAWFGAPIMLMTGPYRLPLPALVKALERYVADPNARAELAQRKLPAATSPRRRA